jgi:NAD(P)-dependent dehydrogenase (short-subunit alcohol dehydrogenase family)
MGREAALVFTQEGARVCVADIAGSAAEETVAACAGGSAFACELDVADEDSVREMMAATADRFGGIDVLYNNAGISPDDDASILETTVEAWQRVQDVNAKGVFLCCKHGIPHLLERGGGSIINVASFVAILGAATSQISYTASKGAVLALSRELGVQFARRGIRVNALCPGPVGGSLRRGRRHQRRLRDAGIVAARRRSCSLAAQDCDRLPKTLATDARIV